MKTERKIPVTVEKGSIDVVRKLIAMNEKEPHAVLATVSDNEPYTSLISYALTPDSTGVLFATPRDSLKYRSMMTNQHVSLLIDTRAGTSGDYMKAESLTIIGPARTVHALKERDELAEIFLKKHPRLRDFVSASTTELMLVRIRRCVHVGSFQVVSEADLR